jgi:hypothetical protein
MIESLLNIASAFGLATSAGLNAYIPLLAVALLGRAGLIQVNSPFDVLMHPAVIGVLVVLLLIEVLADKVPAINHINDIVQTFVRPTAGVIVFAASAGTIGVDPIVAVICGVLLAGSVHAAKSLVVRPIVTATTGGLANPLVSTLEDVIAAVVSFLAIVLPVLMLAVMLLIIIVMVWLLLRRPERRTPAGSSYGKYGGLPR